MDRRLFDELAHKGRVLGRPLEDGLGPLGRLIHHAYRAQISSSLRELGRMIANTVRKERRRRELSSELPSFYGACLSSDALKVVHLIPGHYSNSEEYMTVHVFWRGGFQSKDPGGHDQHATVLAQMVVDNRHYEDLRALCDDR